MKKLMKLAVVLIMAIAMIAPNALPVTGIVAVAEAATVKISQKSLTLVVGKTKVLNITGSKKKVTWTTSKKSVATVSSTGKVSAKASGTTTVTAAVSGKKYTCKVTVKPAANKYLKDAPFDAVEAKIENISIVVPKDCIFEASEAATDDYVATITPASTELGSYINVELLKTGKKATDYSTIKELYSTKLTQETVQSQLQLALNSADLEVTNFETSDFESNLGTAFKATYNVTYGGYLMDIDMYFMDIDNYTFVISVTDAEEYNLDAVAQYVIDSIVVTK